MSAGVVRVDLECAAIRGDRLVQVSARVQRGGQLSDSGVRAASQLDRATGRRHGFVGPAQRKLHGRGADVGVGKGWVAPHALVK